jgi:hypothetical protein
MSEKPVQEGAPSDDCGSDPVDLDEMEELAGVFMANPTTLLPEMEQLDLADIGTTCFFVCEFCDDHDVDADGFVDADGLPLPARIIGTLCDLVRSGIRLETRGEVIGAVAEMLGGADRPVFDHGTLGQYLETLVDHAMRVPDQLEAVRGFAQYIRDTVDHQRRREQISQFRASVAPRLRFKLCGELPSVRRRR